MRIKYADDKPSDCKHCYWWSPTKKKCIRKGCYYISYVPETITMCGGCPYGRAAPCIGWCTVQILKK